MKLFVFSALVGFLFIPTGCGPTETKVQKGNREQVLHLSNGSEPESIDPHIVTGVPEHNVISALTEGLVTEDPVDLHPVPGMAESWDISKDGTCLHLSPA